MKRVLFGSVVVLIGTIAIGDRVIAQVVPDNTLGTQVTQTSNVFEINNGMRSGNNLFHSFSQFSIPTNGSAIFNNATDVQNIFSRVTGSQLSNIDGILKAQGNANLFLMNPNGIIFGPNAQLQLGGSFLGTTANSIKFGDGIEFNTVNAAPALLSVNLPIGLQMGTTPGPLAQPAVGIVVNGPGHRLTSTGILVLLDRSNNPVGLRVGADRSLILIGSDVNLSGGILSGQSGGHVEIGSVQSGDVKLRPLGLGWVGDYTNVQQFNNIHLAQQSLLDVSGQSGSIRLAGKEIHLTESSVATIQNLGSQKSEGITVQATDALTLTGNSPDGRLGSSIQIDNFGTGTAGDINISANQIRLLNAGNIANRTFSAASSGNITINVAGSIVMEGAAPANPFSVSSIATATYASQNAGNVTIATGDLSILNGGSVSSSTSNSGQAGSVQVNASGSIEVAGNNSITFTPSTLVSTTFGSGNAKDVFISTARLLVREGGIIGSSTSVTGDAGSVIIHASESLTVQGRAKASITASRIVSTAEILDPATQAVYGLPPVPQGNAGSLNITTPILNIKDGAYITVKNDGPGKAGDLDINSRSIILNNQGSITASTASGNGGNIRLTLQDSLVLRHGSTISSTAAGQGAGGNLSINAPIILGLENSDIIANATQGKGGNIQITTQGILGLRYRDRLTAENDITASSEFGINGNVQVNTIGINPANALNELPVDVVDSSTQIADRCGAAKTSSFVATGRGGMPQGPTKKKGSDRTWHDQRPLTAANPVVTPIAVANLKPLTEASAIQLNASGAIELVAVKPVVIQTSATCALNP
jgi:filamentous hemagglutinin family protein